MAALRRLMIVIERRGGAEETTLESHRWRSSRLGTTFTADEVDRVQVAVPLEKGCDHHG